ncbi:MAG: metal ABC transporter substrate-binding protein [Anaerolineaceae bacterium]|nr:metal ABC transporter substrate-binding protein [Anaerolineaceae bacterium]
MRIIGFRNKLIGLSFTMMMIVVLTACQTNSNQVKQVDSTIKVIAVESFLADIVQNIAGERMVVDTLMPKGLDPHSFEPTPKDVARISDSDILFVNGAGFEEWLADVIENLPENLVVVESSAGLQSRTGEEEEHVDEDEHADEEEHADEDEHDHEIDPHFWLDPTLVITYAENIRDGLISIDPEGKEIYSSNTEEYIQQLKDLDAYIQEKIAVIPVERRLIVTNHESFGYFADRYGFEIVGTIIHSVSSGAAPSAQQMAQLVDQMRASGAIAIFMETGTNPQLAEQLAKETNIKIVYDLYTHSVSESDGKASTYIDLMKYNVEQMINALGD